MASRPNVWRGDTRNRQTGTETNVEGSSSFSSLIRCQVMDAVVVVFESAYQLSLNWIGNAMNDTIADAVLAIILAAESSPASLKGLPVKVKC